MPFLQLADDFERVLRLINMGIFFIQDVTSYLWRLTDQAAVVKRLQSRLVSSQTYTCHIVFSWRGG